MSDTMAPATAQIAIPVKIYESVYGPYTTRKDFWAANASNGHRWLPPDAQLVGTPLVSLSRRFMYLVQHARNWDRRSVYVVHCVSLETGEARRIGEHLGCDAMHAAMQAAAVFSVSA